jgi:hypothetical protein
MFLLLWTITISGALQPQPKAPDVCKLFVKADVAQVLGADATDGQTLIPGTCSWNAKGANLSISRASFGQGEAGMLLESRKIAIGQGDVVTDETGIGQRAVSTLAANKRTLTLLAVNGNELWTFTLSKGDQPVDVESVLPRLRELAKKAIASQ